MNKLSVRLGCDCPNKGGSICNTERCPIYDIFTDKDFLLSFEDYGINNLDLTFKLERKVNE